MNSEIYLTERTWFWWHFNMLMIEKKCLSPLIGISPIDWKTFTIYVSILGPWERGLEIRIVECKTRVDTNVLEDQKICKDSTQISYRS